MSLDLRVATFLQQRNLNSGTLNKVNAEPLKGGGCAGSGAQGDVYAAWWRQKPVAVKKFTVAADGLHEVQMHLSVGQHPNVVQLRALANMGSSLYMVMEYFPRCAFGSWVDDGVRV